MSSNAGHESRGQTVASHLYEFGPYRLDVLNRRLCRGGEPVPLTPKALDALLALIERRDRVVDKTELLGLLWPGTFVEEANLTQTIFLLRKALGEASDGRQHIDTVPRRGYRFAAEVKETRDEAVPASGGQGAVVAATPARRRPDRRLVAVTFGLLALIALGIAGHQVRIQSNAHRASAGVGGRSIAVLPFQRLGPPQADDEYLGLGMAEALITQLGNLRQLTVRPTAAVRRYADAERDPGQAGRQLGVDWVVDGSIQRAGDRLRATVPLIRTADGVPVWTDRFDTAWTDVFTVQDSISAEVARALALRLSTAEQRQLAKRHTQSPRAHELYLRSRYFWNKRSAEAFLKAIEYARLAIAEDPAYALAYAGLADSYALIGSQGIGGKPRGEAMARAKEAARKALALDETLAEAHTSLAFVLMHHDWNWRESEKEFRRAIELNPSYPTAHHWYAYHLTAQRRHDEAIAEIHRAQQLDPLSLIINTDRAEIYYYARRYDEAVAYARQTLEIEPDFPLAHRILGWALLQQGQYDTAIDEFKRAGQGRPEMDHCLAYAFAASGRRAEARLVLREMERLGRQRYGLTLWLAIPRAVLGEVDEAFEWLEKAHSERDGTLILLSAAPFFDPIRADPRFADLVRRLGLPLSAPAS